MAGCLLTTGAESVTLPLSVVTALEQRGDGDAALLYLALLRHNGTVPPRSLAGELRWDRTRMDRAEQTLRELRLIAPADAPAPAVEPSPAEEHPAYTRDDVTDKLEHNADFRGLTQAVESRLGKRLTTPDLNCLLGLYDYLGLPADVIYLLVGHVAEKVQRRFGQGRRPGMRQIEKEGYAWARMGIDSQAAAVEYLKRYAARQQALPQFMRALQLPQRPPSPSEEKYLTAWQEMGFGPETVALAYDRTILRCQELKWPYLNGILKRWHEKGLHTPEEVQQGDRAAAARQTEDGSRQEQDISWMKEYIHRRGKKEE